MIRCGNCRLLIVLILFTQVYSLNYDVHWLEGTTVTDRYPSSKETVDVYCYTGTTKSIMIIWQTVRFQIKIKNDEFRQYVGGNPEEVFQLYTEDSYGWTLDNFFQTKAQKSFSVNLFNTTCMAINTKHRHSVELHVIRVDIWRVLLMVLGIAVIISSTKLSGNPLFFYLCGIFLGVFASFMVLIYYISKLWPKKMLTYGLLIGGWTVGVYIFQQIFENIRSIIVSYQSYVFWYTLIVSFISFLVCYRIGPPRNERNKNLVMWTLQAVGVLTIFFSSDYREASTAVIMFTMITKYFPESLSRSIRGYWHRRFPPRPRLLTSEEYYEEGARETKHALEELRKYCSSPDCAQWRVMLKLHDSRRFANFVEGDSHLSDSEILDYETYAFSLDRSRDNRNKRNPVAHSSAVSIEISDDDSSGSEEI